MEMLNKKFFFGHQSVGDNIVEGLYDIKNSESDLQLNIIETSNPKKFTGPAFYHGRVGINSEPASKNTDFIKLMKNGGGRKLDIAFFKYCYVDIKSATDVETVFSRYKVDMQLLKEQFPKVRFIHVTVPLTIVQRGFRVLIKKAINRKIGGYDDNIRRNEYNDLLRAEYSKREPIFDIAFIESTYQDGSKSSFSHHGKRYFSLVPDYSKDGRHLNNYGRSVVAGKLIEFLKQITS